MSHHMEGSEKDRWKVVYVVERHLVDILLDLFIMKMVDLVED